MAARLFVLCFLPILALSAAEKKTTGTARGENEDLILTFTVHTDPADIKKLVGDDLGAHYVVAEVKVDPKYGKEIALDTDDFTLRTDKDGERSRPMAPSQIAGRGALIVSQAGTAPVGGMGGINVGSPYPPGTYPGGGYPPYPGGGYPPGTPPMGTGGVGGTGGTSGTDTSDATVEARNSARDKQNPLEKVLEAKVLPAGKTEKSVSGLLYFAMEKQKVKDLELLYGGKENRITLRFK